MPDVIRKVMEQVKAEEEVRVPGATETKDVDGKEENVVDTAEARLEAADIFGKVAHTDFGAEAEKFCDDNSYDADSVVHGLPDLAYAHDSNWIRCGQCLVNVLYAWKFFRVWPWSPYF